MLKQGLRVPGGNPDELSSLPILNTKLFQCFSKKKLFYSVAMLPWELTGISNHSLETKTHNNIFPLKILAPGTDILSFTVEQHY